MITMVPFDSVPIGTTFFDPVTARRCVKVSDKGAELEVQTNKWNPFLELLHFDPTEQVQLLGNS